jgi:ABC-type Fe3+-siderophore transport system permease subunit
MNLDLRIPMGMMFTLVGAILSVFGLVTMGNPMYERSLGINANLDWGLVLLAFGLIMFFFGRRGQKAALLAPPEPESGDPVRRGH